MPPTLADRLRHILEAIEDIRHVLADTTFEQFADDRLMRLLIERLLEIISEAARRLPDDVKAQHRDIPWHRVADLANHLRHAYHRVDARVLWRIVYEDLPPLKAFVAAVIRDADAG